MLSRGIGKVSFSQLRAGAHGRAESFDPDVDLKNISGHQGSHTFRRDRFFVSGATPFALLYLPVHSGGRALDMPVDTGCMVSMISGTHRDHLLAVAPHAEYYPFRTRMRIAHAEERQCLYAIGIQQVPIELVGGSPTSPRAP